MRTILILLGLMLAAPHARAEFLTDQIRQELLEKLAKIENDAMERIDGRFRVAIRAYNQAMGSNEETLKLYLSCIEKVRFQDRYKDNRDYREWREKQEESFSQPGFKLALRYQLRWLVLMLKAASKDADQDALAEEASAIVDSVFTDLASLKDQQQVLNQSAIGSVFAQAYEIGQVKTEIPGSPVAISEIYESVILPPLRSPMKITKLRAAWLKRIKLEEINATAWVNQRTEFRRNGQRDAKREREAREDLRDDIAVNTETFQNETYPELIWQMETDLFKCGDETGAASRMIAHIAKYISHKSASEWTKELQGLLNPQLEQPVEGTSDS